MEQNQWPSEDFIAVTCNSVTGHSLPSTHLINILTNFDHFLHGNRLEKSTEHRSANISGTLFNL